MSAADVGELHIFRFPPRRLRAVMHTAAPIDTPPSIDDIRISGVRWPQPTVTLTIIGEG